MMEQAEDRVHRIGQENSVLVQYLVARGTIDEVLWRMLCTKVKPLFHSSLKSTRKLAASAFKYCDWMKVLAASLRVGFCDE